MDYNNGVYCHATTFKDGHSCSYIDQGCFSNFKCGMGLCYGLPICPLGNTCNKGACDGPIADPLLEVPADKYFYGNSQPVTVFFLSSSAAYTDVVHAKFRGSEQVGWAAGRA